MEITTDLHLINDSWHDAKVRVDLLLTREAPEWIPEAECFEKPVRKSSKKEATQLPVLVSPIVEKLQSVSPLFNLNGKTVFLGSWGMGTGEIGWLVRLLNDRPTFDRYLHEAGITEREVDVFNDAYARELH